MLKVAWKSLRKNGGIGRASINHFTTDKKKTLCNKKIPAQVHCLDAFGVDDCVKCFERKAATDNYLKMVADKPLYFKEVVEGLGGQYEFDGKTHSAWWDAYGDKKNLYIAYGRLACLMDGRDSFRLINNWLYLESKS